MVKCGHVNCGHVIIKEKVKVSEQFKLNVTFIRQDSEEDIGQVYLLLSDPGTQVLPVQQVQEQTKLTHQLLHGCIINTFFF